MSAVLTKVSAGEIENSDPVLHAGNGLCAYHVPCLVGEGNMNGYVIAVGENLVEI